ncbi:MAG: hypothetical protein WDA07_03385 [Leucobacter sp.]
MSDNISGAPANHTASESKGQAITALIAGIIGLVLDIIFFTTPAGLVVLVAGLIFGLVGLITGIIALRQRQSKGMALTGLITGALAVLLAVGIIVFALVFVGAFMSWGA